MDIKFERIGRIFKTYNVKLKLKKNDIEQDSYKVTTHIPIHNKRINEIIIDGFTFTRKKKVKK